MSFTDEQYRWLSEQSYWVDTNKGDKDYTPKEGKTYPINPKDKSLGQYQVLAAEDNTSNGMQAMAVAPLDKNGKPDLSHIVVAYAGTNSSDLKDIQTDIQSIGLGSNKLHTTEETLLSPKSSWIANENPANHVRKTTITTDSQFQTALTFAKEVEKRYPKAKVSTTGHSLGESIAMLVALKQGYNNVGFNGLDTHNLLSKEEIEYMRKHPEQFRNYRHRYDVIGNIMGDEIKTAIYAIL